MVAPTVGPAEFAAEALEAMDTIPSTTRTIPLGESDHPEPMISGL
ncbi:hypothetical protein [Sphingomonas sp. 3-13AW]